MELVQIVGIVFAVVVVGIVAYLYRESKQVKMTTGPSQSPDAGTSQENVPPSA